MALNILTFNSLVVSVLIIALAGILVHLYFFAYRGMKKSKIILSLVGLLFAILLKYISIFAIYAAKSFTHEGTQETLENLSVVPNIIMFLALFCFLYQSVKVEEKKIEAEINYAQGDALRKKLPRGGKMNKTTRMDTRSFWKTKTFWGTVLLFIAGGLEAINLGGWTSVIAAIAAVFGIPWTVYAVADRFRK